MGFAPADAPKLVVLVIVDEPREQLRRSGCGSDIQGDYGEDPSFFQRHSKGAMVVKSEFDSAPRREASGSQPLIDGIKVVKEWDGGHARPHRIIQRNALTRMEGGTGHQGFGK